VAKSFDGPIKLLFPRVLATASSKGEFSLLGLGDIVIPGLFVSLLLRFDAVRAMEATINKYNYLTIDQAPFPKPYFHVSALICFELCFLMCAIFRQISSAMLLVSVLQLASCSSLKQHSQRYCI
jgi:hypothetical protein